MDLSEELITRGVEKIYPSKEVFEKILKSGKKLKLYQGFDPSMPSLHLGNFVGLMKLRQFQKLGHEVIFLVGDFTGMIGDPTDKSAARKMLTREETVINSQKWKEQAGRILDFEGDNPVKMMFNSEWLDKISFNDLIGYASHFTFQQLIERDMFQKRLKEDKPIFLHEFLYPLAQAIDCIVMDVDLEIGGNDQTFNMLAGRNLMKALKNKEKYVLTTKLLVDSEGNKVGKTTGNALFLDSTPEKFYGGIMSFPDEVIALSFELLTETDLTGLEEKIKADPMGEKKRLAFEIVQLLWGRENAEKAEKEFENVYQKREMPSEISELPVKTKDSTGIEELLVEMNLVSSMSEAKRLIKQKAVEIDGRKANAKENILLRDGIIIKVGKTRYAKIKLS